MLKLGSFSIGPIVAALIGFVFVPIITRLVEPSLYGQLSMFITGTSLMSMLIFLGTDQAYVRDFAESSNTGKLWFNSVSIPFILSSVLAGIGIFFWKEISYVLFDEYLYFPTIIFLLTLPVIILERYFLLAVRMHEVGGFYSILTIITKVITAISTISLVYFSGPGLIELVMPITFASVILILLISQSKYSPKFINWSLDKNIISNQLKFGLPLAFSTAQFWILNSLDKLALRTWSSYAEVGIYAAAFSLVIPILLIKNSFTTFWAPMRYRWRKEGVDIERFQKVTDGITLILILIFSAMLPIRWLVVFLLGPAYREAVELVPLALVFPIMYTLSETTSMGITFSKKTSWDILCTGVAALTNVLGNWLLVPNYGAVGAALSTAFSFTIFFWMRTLVANQLWKKLKLDGHIIATLFILVSNGIALKYSDVRIDLITCLAVWFFAIPYFIYKYKKEKCPFLGKMKKASNFLHSTIL